MLRSAASALALVFVLGACAPETPQPAAPAEMTAEEQAAISEQYAGMPFEDWKRAHQREATPEQLAAFEASRRRHDG